MTLIARPARNAFCRCLPGNAYTKTGDSEKAVEYFLKYLEQQPDELEVKWLLNLAYMTLGEYPDKVPPKYLIPPSVFQSAEDVGRFRDVAPAAGLDTFSMAGGVIVDDFENNGRLDVVKSSFDVCAPMQFFHNNGDGTFTDQAAKAGLADQLGGLNMIQADYNNDGCTDILVLRGAWEVGATQVPAAKQLRWHFYRCDRGAVAWRLRPAPKPRFGWTSIMTDCSICSWATKTGRRSFFSTTATARSRIFLIPPGLIRSRSPKESRPPITITMGMPTSSSPT